MSPAASPTSTTAASAAQASTGTSQPDEATRTPAADAPSEATEGADGNDTNRGQSEKPDEISTELPAEVLRDRLTRANSEAARYRVRAKEAEQKLGQAKTVEEYEAAVADFKAKNADLERQVLVNKVARKHLLPDDLAELLKGKTAQELEAHAQVLKKYAGHADPAGREPESLSGGLDPTDDDTFDPVAESRKARSRRF